MSYSQEDISPLAQAVQVSESSKHSMNPEYMICFQAGLFVVLVRIRHYGLNKD